MSSPSLSSYTSVTPRVPRDIRIDGKPLVGHTVVPVPVPAHDGHHCVLVMPKHGAHVVAGFLEPASTGLAYTHAVVVNRTPPAAKGMLAPYSPRITSDVDGSTDQVLDPLCGAAWTSAAWLLAMCGHEVAGKTDAQIEQMVQGIASQQTPTTKLEAGMLAAVLADAADVDVTRYTGSANMGFHGKVSVHAVTQQKAKGKIPFAALLHLDAYARKQWRRPRNWVKPTLSPAGADPAEPAFKLDEWAENTYGLNAYDTQHPDASELHRMYALTGHPIYLLQMLTLFSDMRRLSYYLQHADNSAGKHASWAGVARTPGWWATNLGELVDALSMREDASHATWLSQVVGEIEYLLTELEFHTQPEQWPLAGTTGSAPQEMKDPATGGNIEYQMGWQLSPLAWGLQWIDGACRNAISQKHWLSKEENGTLFNRLAAVAQRARSLWKFVLDYVEKELFHPGGSGTAPMICYAFSKKLEPGTTSPAIKVWQPVAAGTGMWHLAPLARAGRLDRPMGATLLAKAKSIDKSMTGDLAEMCPEQVGKLTLVPPVDAG